MATSAIAALHAFARTGPMIANSNMVANTGAVQAGATRITSPLSRFVKGGTNASAILPSLISNEAGSDIYVVVNNTGAAMTVYPGVGDTMNTVANAALTVANAGFGVFVKAKYTEFSYVAPNWSAAAFT